MLGCVDYNVMSMGCLSLSYLRIFLDVDVDVDADVDADVDIDVVVHPAVVGFVAVIFVDSVWSRM